jgi:hypothetical protein
MSTIPRSPCHRSATIILFDAGRLSADHVLREIRARFGRGVLISRPHDTRPYTAGDLADAAAMFGDEAARPLPPITPCQLMAQIKSDLARCKDLARSIDAFADSLRRDAWAARVAPIYNALDEPLG